ncbi:YncE family protein [Mucilaginibacter sp. OK098]|uniref:YncE family protein n=1 Tax=Mucilaginibacter sp. OK098 TaxID=1855297 RepID=UPI000913233D|nr:YncE family protein [Mucilaginibacter sp. OK098]SHN23220.1 DNA-binding beta-propeller fold protein YncE [Mucilaginibacter sp. OK098]
MKISKAILFLSFIVSTCGAYAQQKPLFHISKIFHINSGGGYDYLTVDTASDRLYVSHGTKVNVINKITGDSIAVISTDKDVHGIALVHALGKGYISNGSSNSVLVFDLKTFKVLAHVPAGEFSDGIFYDDFSKKVISCNGKSKNMTVIDPVTDQPVATIQLSGWPETAVSDGAGKIYVNNAEKAEVDVVDAVTYKVIHTWPNAPAKGASGLAIDRKNMLLFAGCDNKTLIVMSALTGKIVASLPIGDESDAVGFDKTLKLVYSSNGEGTLTVIKEMSSKKFAVIQTLKTKKGARTMAVDQLTHKIYSTTGDFAPKKQGEFRPSLIPGTFKVLVIDK